MNVVKDKALNAQKPIFCGAVKTGYGIGKQQHNGLKGKNTGFDFVLNYPLKAEVSLLPREPRNNPKLHKMLQNSSFEMGRKSENHQMEAQSFYPCLFTLCDTHVSTLNKQMSDGTKVSQAAEKQPRDSGTRTPLPYITTKPLLRCFL